MSGRSEILAAVVTLVAGVTGLSSDTVHRGVMDVSIAPAGPCAYIDAPSLQSTHDDQLGSYRRHLAIEIVLVTPAGATVLERDTALDTLVDNVLAVLEADRTLSGVSVPVVDMILESLDVLLGEEITPAMHTQAVCRMVVKVSYIATSGLGI